MKIGTIVLILFHRISRMKLIRIPTSYKIFAYNEGMYDNHKKDARSPTNDIQIAQIRYLVLRLTIHSIRMIRLSTSFEIYKDIDTMRNFQRLRYQSPEAKIAYQAHSWLTC